MRYELQVKVKENWRTAGKAEYQSPLMRQLYDAYRPPKEARLIDHQEGRSRDVRLLPSEIYAGEWKEYS